MNKAEDIARCPYYDRGKCLDNCPKLTGKEEPVSKWYKDADVPCMDQCPRGYYCGLERGHISSIHKAAYMGEILTAMWRG